MRRVSNQQTTSPRNDTTDCMKDRQWHYFLASSLITFALGLFILLLYKLVAFSCSRWSSRRRERRESTGQVEVVSFTTKLKWMAERWISGQTVTGRILVSYLYPFILFSVSFNYFFFKLRYRFPVCLVSVR